MVSHVTDDVRSAMGVNDRAGLMEVEALAQRQTCWPTPRPA